MAESKTSPSPKRPLFDGWDWRYLELIFYKTYADLRVESSRTYVGFIWWFIDPLIQMLIYFLVFGVIWRAGRHIEHYISFLLVGITAWKWLQASVLNGSNAIITNAYLTTHVHLPKVIFPVTVVLTDTVRFLFALAMMILWLWGARLWPSQAYLALPAVLLAHFLFLMGVALVFAAVMPFVPDLHILIDNVLRVLFFLSAILYPSSDIGRDHPWHLALLKMNPMVDVIESYRDVLMYGRWPNWYFLAMLSLLSILLAALGARLIFRWDRLYPRVLPQ